MGGRKLLRPPYPVLLAPSSVIRPASPVLRPPEPRGEPERLKTRLMANTLPTPPSVVPSMPVGFLALVL